jgi:hypothetical protein
MKSPAKSDVIKSDVKSHITDFGIPGMGRVPYGIHMCQFYRSPRDLLDGLVPYFLAGLANNERCIWVSSSPLGVAEIGTEIAKSPELNRGLASGQLAVFDAVEWYGDPAAMDAEKIIGRWIGEEELALANGFHGLRISGNTSFVPRAYWSRLMDYEMLLHSKIKDRRIVACCNYHRGDCRPVDILEVVHRHDGALDRSGRQWDIFLHAPSSTAAF